MKKSILSVFGMAIFALAMLSNSFDNSAFEVQTIDFAVDPSTELSMTIDGRNSVSGTISTNGISSSASGSGTVSASVTSAGGTGSFSATSTSGGGNSTFTSSSSSSSTSSSSTSTTTTSGGFDICDYVSSSYLRALFGCD